jgi:hypothetical protein
MIRGESSARIADSVPPAVRTQGMARAPFRRQRADTRLTHPLELAPREAVYADPRGLEPTTRSILPTMKGLAQ